MSMITLNDRKFSHKLGPDSTLDDLVNEVLAHHAGQEEVITNITVNGRLLSPEEEDSCLPKSLQELGEVDLKMQSSLELAFDALDSCNVYIDTIIGKIRVLTQLYQENKIEAANEQFSEVIDIIDLYVQLISKVHRTMRAHLGSKFTKTETIQELEIHLLSILKALLPAKEKNDIIMLCDLLEYELVDNLTQWKIVAIPEMKTLKNV